MDHGDESQHKPACSHPSVKDLASRGIALALGRRLRSAYSPAVARPRALPRMHSPVVARPQSFSAVMNAWFYLKFKRQEKATSIL